MTDLEKAVAELLAEATGMANDLRVARRRAEHAERRVMGLEQQVEILKRTIDRLELQETELGEKLDEC
jgi:hypothetical protein